MRKTLWSEIVAKTARKTPKAKAVPAAATKQAKTKAKVPKPPQTPAHKAIRNLQSTGHAASPETLVIRRKATKVRGVSRFLTLFLFLSIFLFMFNT